MANRLKILRARLGISQDELARRSGLSQPTISALELSGVTAKTRAETLHKLAEGLGVEIETLFDDTPLAV